MNAQNASVTTIDSSGQPQKDPKEILTFLYASIADAQAAIRAVDTKLSIILVLLSIALTKGDILLQIYKAGIPKSQSLCVAATMLFIVAWAAGMWSTFMGLAAIDNPTNHICNITTKGTFYSSRTFTPGFIDSLYNRQPPSKSDFGILRDRLPQNAEQAIDELAFEQMKLAYIRAIKIKRCNVAYRSAALALCIFAIAALASCL